jgi:RHS repeat-associated protein
MRVVGDPVPANNGLFQLLGDHLGGTNIVANPSGIMLHELRYRAWGEIRYPTTPTANTDYRYTGQRQETALGLYYYRARWYDPALGRFAQADTITVGLSAHAWDHYGYVQQNPLRYNDPSGHVCSDPEDPSPSCESGQPYPVPQGPPPDPPFPPSDPDDGGGGSGGGGQDPEDEPLGPAVQWPWDPLASDPWDNALSCLSKPYLCAMVSGNGLAKLASRGQGFLGVACVLEDCILSGVGVATSFVTTFAIGGKEGWLIAEGVDILATGISIARTNAAHDRGEISDARQYLLNGSAVVGVIPGSWGLGSSIVNLIFTATGWPP